MKLDTFYTSKIKPQHSLLRMRPEAVFIVYHLKVKTSKSKHHYRNMSRMITRLTESTHYGIVMANLL